MSKIQTSNQYAESNNISKKTVYNWIAKGKLFSHKFNNKIYVSEQPFEIEQLSVFQNKKKIQNRFDLAVSKYEWQVKKDELNLILQKQKLKNLRADTRLKNQKVILKKQEYKKQICNKIFQVFSDSFADLKGLIIELKLTEIQLQQFNKILQICLQKFEKGLEQYSKTEQIQEEEEEENTDEK